MDEQVGPGSEVWLLKLLLRTSSLHFLWKEAYLHMISVCHYKQYISPYQLQKMLV